MDDREGVTGVTAGSLQGILSQSNLEFDAPNPQASSETIFSTQQEESSEQMAQRLLDDPAYMSAKIPRNLTKLEEAKLGELGNKKPRLAVLALVRHSAALEYKSLNDNRWRAQKVGMDDDTLSDAIRLGVHNAATAYDSKVKCQTNRPRSFVSFASIAIRWSVNAAMAYKMRRPLELSLDSSPPDIIKELARRRNSWDHSTPLPSELVEQTNSKEVAIAMVRGAISMMSETWKTRYLETVSLRYGLDGHDKIRPYDEVAEILGLKSGHQLVGQRIEEAEIPLRKRLHRMEKYPEQFEHNPLGWTEKKMPKISLPPEEQPRLKY